LYLKAAQSNTTVSDLIFPKKSTKTAEQKPEESTKPTPTTADSATPTPTPELGSDGKPQSEANTKPSASTSLSINFMNAVDGDHLVGNPLRAKTNRVVSGNCSFVFKKGSETVTKTEPLQTVTGYSACSHTIDLTPGEWSVTVSTSDSTGTATSETKTITVN
jgi:hypothetical protein